MNDEEIDSLVERHSREIVVCVLAGLHGGATADQIAILLVHPSYSAYGEIRSWVGENEMRDLGPNGFVCGAPRKEAVEALAANGMQAVADALDGDEAEGFALIVLYETSALIRHVEIERVTISPQKAPMVRGGSA